MLAPHLWTRRFTLLSGISGLAVIVFALLLSSGLPLATRSAVSSLGLLVLGTLVGVCAFRRARTSPGQRAWAWYTLGLGAIFAVLSNVLGLLVGLRLLPQAAGLATEGGLVVAYASCIVTILLIPGVRRRNTDTVRMVLDGLVVGGSVLFVASVTVFPQLLHDDNLPWAERLSTVLIPIIDVIIATLAALLILRAGRRDRTVLLLVGVGFLSYAISDLAYAVKVARSGYQLGSITDLGYIVAYLLLILATQHEGATSDPQTDDETPGTSRVLGTVVLFALFIVASTVSVLRLRTEDGAIGQLVLWTVIVLGVIGRQLLLIIDNDRLRRSLESRVAERTRELREAQRRQELLLTSVGDGIYGVDSTGTIIFVNPATARILNRSVDDLIGRDAHACFHAPQPDGTPFPPDGCYVWEAIRDGVTTVSEEDTYVRGDGERIAVDVTASPVSDAGRVSGAVVVFRDVTERREVERMKSEFVSIVSHELRTPLTSIRGSLGLVTGGALGPLPEPARRMLDIALQSSERLTRLINDILDIERIETGTLPMDVAEYSAAQLVTSAMAQLSSVAADSRIRIEVGTCDGDVHADFDRVVQTLINLVGNAIKFSPPDSAVSVSAQIREATVEFAVADQGRGIPEMKLEAIFSRFVQVDSSDARELGGTGLGLAISRSIVERLGGQIWAESTLGVGTTFRFSLPRAAGVPPSTISVHSPTVVVCDDDPVVVRVLSKVLEDSGYRAIGATDGDRAIRLAQEEQPAAVVLDLRMEGTSGAEVVHRLRSDPATATIPIVVVSGLSPAGDPGLAAATDGWLVKPIDESRLAATVAIAIDRHASHGSVLVVEDDDQLARVLETMLGQRGLVVTHAAGQQQALAQIASAPPDVLILDLHLPDGNGFELVETLRTSGRLARLPLVVYSAADVQPQDRERLSLGAQTVFLTKGRITPDQLERRVVELMDQVTGRGVRTVPALPDAPAGTPDQTGVADRPAVAVGR